MYRALSTFVDLLHFLNLHIIEQLYKVVADRKMADDLY